MSGLGGLVGVDGVEVNSVRTSDPMARHQQNEIKDRQHQPVQLEKAGLGGLLGGSIGSSASQTSKGNMYSNDGWHPLGPQC